MRVPRSAALALVPAVLCFFSVCVTTSAHTEAMTPRAHTTRASTISTANGPNGPKGAWQLVFSDHFSGLTLNKAKWSTCYYFGCTDAGNNELEWYQASQVKVHDGTVSLTVVPSRIHDKKYVSGMLSSHGKFSFRYGYAQIVAKLPRGLGLWSAFWTAPEIGAWPPEIDIMENWAQSHSVSFYVHFDVANHFDSANVYLPTASSAFHTYGVDWEPGSLSWYVDGFLVSHLAVSITQPAYLVADLAVNGKLPPDSAVRFPQSLVIRSIEVWQHPSLIGAEPIS
jgi:beta-glucanase (GH16 family)